MEDLPVDADHHPGNPKLNFLPLYLTVTGIFVISVSVKIMTCFLKKRQAKMKAANPDLEAQTSRPFERFWYPWRVDKNGNYIDPKKAKADAAKTNSTSSASGSGSETVVGSSSSDGTGTSSQTLAVCPSPPRLPPLAHIHGDRAVELDTLVHDRVPGGGPMTDESQVTPMMSGALGPDHMASSSPINLQQVNSRFSSSGIDDSSSSFYPTPDSHDRKDEKVNPYSWKPSFSPSLDTPRELTPATTSRPNKNTSDRHNNNKDSSSTGSRFKESFGSDAVSVRDYAHGYGAPRKDDDAFATPFDTPTKVPAKDDRRQEDRHHGSGSGSSGDRSQRERGATSSSQGTTSASPSRQGPSRGQSSRQETSSSRAHSSRPGQSSSSSREQGFKKGDSSSRAQSSRQPPSSSSRNHTSSSQGGSSSSTPHGQSSSSREAKPSSVGGKFQNLVMTTEMQAQRAAEREQERKDKENREAEWLRRDREGS